MTYTEDCIFFYSELNGSSLFLSKTYSENSVKGIYSNI